MKENAEKSTNEIMNLMYSCELPPSEGKIRNVPKPAPELSVKEIERRGRLAVDKAEDLGIYSMSSEERLYYSHYLLRNAYKKNAKGEDLKPIHANIADLVLCDTRIFVLNQDLYIYDPRVGTYFPDYGLRNLRHKIRSYLEREFIEDKTIGSIANLIVNDRRLALPADRINNRPNHWKHFQNGYYDNKADVLRPHNPDYYDVNVIPWTYEPGRYPSNYKYVIKGEGILRETVEESLTFDAWIEEAIPNYYDRIMLYQYIGYAMTLETREQKFLLICGPGGTGKSTLLKLIEEIFGGTNVSHVSLQGLQERFTPINLYMKQANICADIPLTGLKEVDVIKKLTGEDTIFADRKGIAPISFQSYARLFFSANSIPYVDEKTNAFYRRMLVLKMDRAPKSIDPDLFEKLRDEIPNIITRCVEELYCSAGTIDVSDNSREAVKSAHIESDSVEAFIEDRCKINSISRVDRRTLYDAYKNYCFTEGRRELTPTGFYKTLSNKGYKQIKGKTRDFIGLDLSNIVQFRSDSTADTTADNGRSYG